MAERSIDFRPLTRLDFSDTVEWLREPHVAEWWDVPPDIERVEQAFRACVDGIDPARVFVILADERPVGIIQMYRLDDNPDYAATVGVDNSVGIDLFVGDPTVIGGGFGSSVLRTFLNWIVWDAYPEVSNCMAGQSVRNLRSQRAFEKAGFVRVGVARIPNEDDDEVIMVAARPVGAPLYPDKHLLCCPDGCRCTLPQRQ